MAQQNQQQASSDGECTRTGFEATDNGLGSIPRDCFRPDGHTGKHQDAHGQWGL